MHQEQQRNRHGHRGVPPVPRFNFSELPDDVLLTEREVAAVGRWSTNTLGAWRRQPDHPLKWFVIAGRHVRYRVADVRAFLVPTPRLKLPKGSATRQAAE
jgi:hypothetical protein